MPTMPTHQEWSWCASLGDELELLPLSFGWLLARRILARLDEVSPRLQHLAASLDHLAVPMRQLSLIADTVRQAVRSLAPTSAFARNG